ncbi:MAG TPA: hypothetical protein DCS05_00930 [Nitrospiraceae bacterium]|nr:hypothetical protein [Nitrospiraceae bacterium]
MSYGGALQNSALDMSCQSATVGCADGLSVSAAESHSAADPLSDALLLPGAESALQDSRAVRGDVVEGLGEAFPSVALNIVVVDGDTTSDVQVDASAGYLSCGHGDCGGFPPTCIGSASTLIPCSSSGVSRFNYLGRFPSLFQPIGVSGFPSTNLVGVIPLEEDRFAEAVLHD